MAASGVRKFVAGLATLAVFGVIVADLGLSGQGKAPKPVPRVRPMAKPIAMPGNLVGLEIKLGRKDEKPTVLGR